MDAAEDEVRVTLTFPSQARPAAVEVGMFESD